MILIAIYLYCSGEIHLGVLSLLFYFHDLSQVLMTLHWLNHFNTECSTFECTSWLFYEVWILYALVRCVNYGSKLGLANGSPYEKENFLWARSANILQSHTESFKHKTSRHDHSTLWLLCCVDLMCTSFFHSVKSSCLSSKQECDITVRYRYFWKGYNCHHFWLSLALQYIWKTKIKMQLKCWLSAKISQSNGLTTVELQPFGVCFELSICKTKCLAVNTDAFEWILAENTALDRTVFIFPSFLLFTVFNSWIIYR